MNAFEVKPGEIYKDENVTITAFQVNHGTWDHAYGYRIETPERVIVISGDTAPSAELIRDSEGCYVLLHERYSTEGQSKLSLTVQRRAGTYRHRLPARYPCVFKNFSH